ncbi:MAG: biotin/lipoyl-containing protein [Halioglobus sp.]|nr:biotin/lipoyl-containing protein [Halioglobus sp.]
MSIEQVNVPDIGGAEGAEVIELLVQVGDEVQVDDGLVLLESDKASMEIPSTVAGKVVEMLVSEGDELVEGAPVAKIEVAGDADDAGQSDQRKEKARQAGGRHQGREGRHEGRGRQGQRRSGVRSGARTGRRGKSWPATRAGRIHRNAAKMPAAGADDTGTEDDPREHAQERGGEDRRRRAERVTTMQAGSGEEEVGNGKRMSESEQSRLRAAMGEDTGSGQGRVPGRGQRARSPRKRLQRKTATAVCVERTSMPAQRCASWRGNSVCLWRRSVVRVLTAVS